MVGDPEQDWTETERQLIESHLDKIASSEIFSHSGRLVDFLQYLVKAKLTGSQHQVDQINIAIDLMGRDASFDPSIDSIVRVEAGRLRSKMREYYSGVGMDDKVRFDLPKGRYRLNIEINADDEASSAIHDQNIHLFKTRDGTTLAYSVTGKGKPMVKAANWLSHLEFDYLSPVWRHWWKDLSEHYSLVRYDERGCGLSDWEVSNFSFDAWVEDLEEIIEHTGLDRFSLLGISQGSAVAIAYAVRHPEKVSHLILYGGFVQGHRAGNLSKGDIEMLDVLVDMIRIGWGREQPAFRQTFSSLLIPDGSAEQYRHLNELQRISTSPENAEKFFNIFQRIDVMDLAARIKIPTIVLHAREDAGIPFKMGRQLASTIPGAKFVPLESKNHILIEGEPAWDKFMHGVVRFIE